MSKPCFTSFLVALVFNSIEVLNVARFVSVGILLFHKSKQPKSGNKTTLRPFNTLVFALFKLLALPQAV